MKAMNKIDVIRSMLTAISKHSTVGYSNIRAVNTWSSSSRTYNNTVTDQIRKFFSNVFDKALELN